MGLRTEAYKYGLRLVYDYLIEYAPFDDLEGKEPDLMNIENAVAYGVASALNDCDETGKPLYSVALLSRHEVFKNGKCIAWQNPFRGCSNCYSLVH